MSRYIFLLILLTSFLSPSLAQEKCGAPALEEKYRALFGESKQEFESWLSEKQLERTIRRLQPAGDTRIASTVYTIPVVVHVLHQGEEYGVGSNIPDEQIFSQIESLNEDFRRLNADTTETRDVFRSVAADVEIQFALAKRDPEGLPTSGIVRTRAGKASYDMDEEVELAAVSYWNPDDYLNIWVTNLKSSLLGFAQFPVSDQLGLHEDVINNFFPDGVTIDYEFFGEGFNTNSFSTGRTATHEIGHYLGLRHIWGDGRCNTDDYLEDTPAQDGPSSSASCQLTKATCGSLDMIENFMDYSPDVCMNIFTKDQKERMRAVLEYSPRRRTLLASNADEPPLTLAVDAGIRAIHEPAGGICDSRFIPEAEIRNYGTEVIEQVEVRALINGEVWDTRTVNTPLAPLATYTIAFDEVWLTDAGLYETSFEIVSVKNGTDQNPSNDIRTVEAVYQKSAILPLTEDFESLPLELVVKPQEDLPSFSQITTAPRDAADNQAIKFGFFGADSILFGAREMLLSPVIDLPKYPGITLNFEYAYGHSGGNNVDGLIVAVSRDCGNNFAFNNIVFRRFGDNLATVNIEKGDEFVPSGPSEWRSVQIPLAGFQGADKIQIAFIAQNGLGNSLYLDNVNITSNFLADYDIGIADLLNLPFLTCLRNIQPTLLVKNFGKQTITNFNVYYEVGGIEGQLAVEDIELFTGQGTEVALPLPQLEDGDYELKISLEAPNQNLDERTSDNSWNAVFHIRSAADIIPLRETFARTRNEADEALYRLSNAAGRTWETVADNSLSEANSVALMESFELATLGEEFWLATPVLNLSGLTEASLLFKTSYAKRANRSERLRVMVSTDCGTEFEDIVYDKRGGSLAVTESEEAWVPQSPEDWRTEFVDLSAYAGRSSVVVALVGTNGNGNNLYLDDIEFFVSADSVPVIPAEDIVRVFPNPAKDEFQVAFNLPERQHVTIRLIDLNGRILLEKVYQNTLNQTYSLTTVAEANGVYLIHVVTPTVSSVQRVIIRH